MCDVRVENHGSVVVFEAQTPEARRIMHDEIETESWMWMGRDRLCVDHGVSEGLYDYLVMHLGLDVE
jgi:hypothetical protein